MSFTPSAGLSTALSNAIGTHNANELFAALNELYGKIVSNEKPPEPTIQNSKKAAPPLATEAPNASK